MSNPPSPTLVSDLPPDWSSRIDDVEFRIMVERTVRAAAALRAVSEGVNPVTGDRFFRALVRQLTYTLGVDIAFVAEAVGGGRAARTIAWCADGSLRDNFVHPLEGTPCAVLWTEPSCFVPRDAQARFRDDSVMRELEVESYLAVRLQGTGAGPLGWLGVMHRRPIDCPGVLKTILEVFASRAAAEIERRRSELAARVFQEQLERRFAERTAALRAANERLADQVVHHRAAERARGDGPRGRWPDRPPRPIPHWAAITRFADGRFLEVSDSFLRRFGYSRDEVVGHTVHELGIWVTPQDRDRLLALLLAKGAVRDFTFDVRTKGGEIRIARLAGDVIGSGDERFILAVADDVTETEEGSATPL